jgi:exonuclease SbcD
MRFVHCADVHLDSPLRGLARYEGAPVERLRRATRDAFERLVRCAIDEKADFVVIAGDLYDGDRDDFQTAMFLQGQLHALRDAQIPVAIAYGNHDAANEITKRLRLPDNVFVFPHDAAGQKVLEDAGAVLHGRSYPTRVVTDDLSAGYHAPVDGALNVGVLHTSLDGRPGHDPYAPCTLDALVRRGYAYWALGHVHAREEHEVDGVHVVFPGNLQGRDVKEVGPKGATVVDYDADRVRRVSRRDLAPVRWARREVDLRDVADVDEALERVVADLGELRASCAADAASAPELHAVRVVLRASTAFAHEWLRHTDRYETQLRADAGGGGDDLWIERVEVCAPPRAPSGERRSSERGSGETPDSEQPGGEQPGGEKPGGEQPGGEKPGGEAIDAVRQAFARLRAAGTGSQSPRGEIAGLLAGVRRRFGPDLEEALGLGAAVLDPAALDDLLDEAEALLVAELEAGD